MDVKYNYQNLAEILANSCNLPRRQAETFVRTYFEVISTFLLKDNIVKVKGLGTFKLIEVSDRESIHVNTGERIVIEGHAKVTFTPDNSLRDLINKPFMDFETVILHDDTVFDDEDEATSAENLSADEGAETTEGIETIELDESPDSTETFDSTDTEDTSTSIDTEGAIDATESAETEEVALASETLAVADEVTSSENEESHEPMQKSEEVTEGETEESIAEPSGDEMSREEETEKRKDEEVEKTCHAACDAKMAKMVVPCGTEQCEVVRSQQKSHTQRIVKAFLVLLLMILSYLAGYYRVQFKFELGEAPIQETLLADTLLTDSSMSEEELPIVTDPSDTLESDSLSLDTTTSAQSTQTLCDSLQAIANEYPQIPGEKYLIVGTMDEHIMKTGDNLYRIAKKHYGHTRFVKYIIFYNNFENPNVIPPNFVIKLPKLQEVEDF